MVSHETFFIQADPEGINPFAFHRFASGFAEHLGKMANKGVELNPNGGSRQKSEGIFAPGSRCMIATGFSKSLVERWGGKYQVT